VTLVGFGPKRCRKKIPLGEKKTMAKKNKSAPMNEQWEYFPFQSGESVGTVVFNHGLSASIDEFPIHQSVRFKLNFKSPSTEGLPGAAESKIAELLETRIEAELAERSGLYTGRITFEGQRLFYSYVDSARRIDHWASFTAKAKAKLFVKSVESEGFQVDSVPDSKSKQGTYDVQFYREDVPELSSMTALTIELASQALKLNGTYAGWEAFVVKKA